MTIQRVISFFTILFLSIPSFAQDFVFEGLINSELKVRIRYNLSEDKKAEGYCIFEATQEKHLLSGEQKEDGSIILNQKNGEKFQGKVMASYMYKGVYLNTEGVEQGSFLLTKIDATIESDEALLVAKEEEHDEVKQSLTPQEIDQILTTHLKEFRDCNQKGIDPSKCRQFTSMALTEIFKTNDFKDEYVGGQYLTMTEAYDKIAADKTWKMLGDGNQATFTAAQEKANNGEIVLVVYPFKGYIQIALMRAGDLKMSSKWGMKVPTVSIYFHNDPEKSSISKSINYIWRGPDNVEVWVKK
ncbi:hypothetical protein KMW28_13030 [Flammeovirga yaeyamensis]|uniref:Uncharacterized protein n=1 Tax=Flammeovirga yaeyamensis TaxID=367791 RepID=A0AAX1MZL1_9BACT|nr:hypothetical protein [Flammeovirga yaeyamensis]MBB3695905.1 hypothetical protein [Flammeovirga yaeyamensis]NMF34594.1 hypothetical protein [Flammeovirga yaeyamensis]QWG00576.1 hypothetical protein KMW28_13030 [Flammeovirga yaeyamensis]